MLCLANIFRLPTFTRHRNTYLISLNESLAWNEASKIRSLKMNWNLVWHNWIFGTMLFKSPTHRICHSISFAECEIEQKLIWIIIIKRKQIKNHSWSNFLKNSGAPGDGSNVSITWNSYAGTDSMVFDKFVGSSTTTTTN